ncbi:MAG: hypothetical protein L3J33_07185 [Rhodobacteraceae bacterium]|nr:hypothetical protein [Paracoccaceae bacterium]
MASMAISGLRPDCRGDVKARNNILHQVIDTLPEWSIDRSREECMNLPDKNIFVINDSQGQAGCAKTCMEKPLTRGLREFKNG